MKIILSLAIVNLIAFIFFLIEEKYFSSICNGFAAICFIYAYCQYRINAKNYKEQLK